MRRLAFFALSLLFALAGITLRATPQEAVEILVVEPPLKPALTWAFVPATVTVKVGTVLTWRNTGNVLHTVDADDGKTFLSGNMPKGSTFSFTASAPGTISYHCKYHLWMKAKIIVVP